jgi:hypothetical protein
MEAITAGVSWIDVIVGAVLAFVLGWLWYSPQLFGKQWAAALGIELGSASSMPMAAMVSQGVGLILVAWACALVGANFWIWAVVVIGFAVLQYSTALFGKVAATAAYINAGYLLAVGLLVWLVRAFLPF